MYIVKFDRAGIRWKVSLFEKKWSDDIMTNEINCISTKKFLLHSSGYRWANKQICKYLFTQHELEIING